jgi:hypothetical protein
MPNGTTIRDEPNDIIEIDVEYGGRVTARIP